MPITEADSTHETTERQPPDAVLGGVSVCCAPNRPPDLDTAIRAARLRLQSLQNPDGHWAGELEGDSILETDYALMLQFLGRADIGKLRELCRYALGQWQQADGGLPIYPGGPSDVSASVKAYFACKLAGHTADEPRMARLRERIMDMGGITQCNTFTKLYLAMFGQYDWDRVPTIPPELMLAPGWFYVNIGAMSAWSRAILIPLAIINATRPVHQVPPQMGIEELHLEPTHRSRESRSPLQGGYGQAAWRNLFLMADRLLKLYGRRPIRPIRQASMLRAERWILEHQRGSDGIGAILPAMTHSAMALKCLGYPDDHPAIEHELCHLQRFEIHDERGIHVQPCLSPVWDTAISLNALAASDDGAREQGSRRAAVDWLLDHQIRTEGDWSNNVRGVQPGGWAFEYRNPWYPDVDDTAMVVIALNHSRPGAGRHDSLDEAIERGVGWMLAMQSRNGGWASFDKNNTRMLLQYVPYADHNAMLDPPTVDVTARVIEALCSVGVPPSSRPIRRAVRFVLENQEPDGSWFGRWGVNYIYGTWQAIRGLLRAGMSPQDSAIRKGVAWLMRIQNEDGGWGEGCGSYADPSMKGIGPSTASQTAWALLALISGGEARSDACRRGINYLLANQSSHGGWDETWFTGTGFPRVFYLRYHLYSLYFPLWALGEYRRSLGN